jgi:acyl-CoA synthetase (AMP-forming)/AMP-acid ligase II
MSKAVATRIEDERMLSSAIDERALTHPCDIFYSIPKDDNDLSQGFVDITCSKFANATNHAAAWLQTKIDESGIDPFDAIAYQGPNDLRYPILAVAAAKVGRKVRLSQ